ncbi:MAG: hypothetical protein HY075_16890, partial [Deltaproteobacteria bacterium]|nr:hypothetical protein [Deltaproteobacteria bacterium]
LFIITALSLVSSVAMADGFRCQGQDFRVKLFNETQPGRGTRNPAVLVVSERSIGTLATLEGEEITKTNRSTTVVYEGQTNGRQDGRFVAVKLVVAKTADTDGTHLARLTVNADGQSRSETLSCERYLKRDQQ